MHILFYSQIDLPFLLCLSRLLIGGNVGLFDPLAVG